jgi:hypothetical protein
MIWQVSALAQSRLDYGRGILAIELQLPEIQGKASSLLGYHNYMYMAKRSQSLLREPHYQTSSSSSSSSSSSAVHHIPTCPHLHIVLHPASERPVVSSTAITLCNRAVNTLPDAMHNDRSVNHLPNRSRQHHNRQDEGVPRRGYRDRGAGDHDDKVHQAKERPQATGTEVEGRLELVARGADDFGQNQEKADADNGDQSSGDYAEKSSATSRGN